jgi:hypothetical protein
MTSRPLLATPLVLILLACGGSSDPEGSGGGGSGGGSTSTISSGGSGGGFTGCTSDADCPENQGCYFDDAACTAGHCEVFQMSDCGPGYPVCRCDGTVDPAGCELTQGHAVTTDTSCFPTTFACGPTTMCVSGQESCSSVPGPSAQYSCQPLPEECLPTPDCSCFGDPGFGCQCSQDEFGNLELTCSG